MIREDIVRYYRSRQPTSAIRKIIECWRSPGLWAVAFFRFSHWTLNQKFALKMICMPLHLYLFHRTRCKWGIEITPTATIGPGFIIQHQGGIFVGPVDLVVGKNFTIHHDVTIGFGSAEGKGGPVIGDDVVIAPGAKILGRVRIGNNVRVGPNAVVMKSIPDDSVVSVPEPRIMKFPFRLAHPAPGYPQAVKENTQH